MASETPKRDVTELVDVAARAMWNQNRRLLEQQQADAPANAQIKLQDWEELPAIVQFDWREDALPVVEALLEKIDGKPLHEIDPTIISDAVPVPDDQCGDYPAPCNCDDPFTHGGHSG